MPTRPPNRQKKLLIASVLIAIDSQGQEHVVVSQTLLPGDKTIYDKHNKFDYDVKKIKFVHDNLGQEYWDVLWFYPEIENTTFSRIPI